MPELLLRLQTALAEYYWIDRELGRGGMATVFLAQDLKHNRPVALKVLSPELASGIAVERFLREIRIAARLAHPHILPLLDSGESQGLLYYVMPYVEGESLRTRLLRERRLALTDALRLAREVVDALGHAHAQGVVHRDIKPENILLQAGHAVVSDFGIARAISAAGGERLTETGSVIGTPSYMSPEQLVGSSDIDGRSDIYSLGCVLSEMLTGELPLPGAPSTAVPTAVRPALKKALASSPGDRFATAADFADALGQIGHPWIRSILHSRRSLLLLVGTALAMIVVAATVLVRHHARAVLDPNLIAVAPFDVFAPNLEQWREGIVDILSRNLDGAGPLRAVPLTIARRRWQGRADRSSAAEFGRRTGAGLVVFGSLLTGGGDSVRLTTSLLDASTRRVLAELQLSDHASRIARLLDSLTVTLLREVGHTRAVAAVRHAALASASLPALKAFLQGEQYYRRARWDSALAYYDRAIALDSTFAAALRRAGRVRGWRGWPGDEDIDVEFALRAAAFNHGLAPRESLLVTADSLRAALTRELTETRFWSHAQRLLATLLTVTDQYPEDAEGWYEAGEAGWYWGHLFGATQQDLLEAFNQAIALDSAFAPAYYHAVQLAINLGANATAQRYARAYLRLNPRGRDAASIGLLQTLMDPVQERLPDLQRRLDTVPAAVVARARDWLLRWPDSAETAVRLARLLAAGERAKATFARGALAEALGYRGHLREAFAIAQSEAADNVASFSLVGWALLGAVPPDTAAATFGRWLHGRPLWPLNPAVLALPWWAASGDTATLQEYVRRADSLASHTSMATRFAWYAAERARAYLALARRDTALALSLFMAVPDSLPGALCPLCYTERLVKAQLLVARGRDLDASRLLLDQRLPPKMFDPREGLWALEWARIGERLGNREKALSAYRFVADVWRGADPELQPYVTEARAALKRLGSER